MNNLELKQRIKKSKMHQYEIAKCLGVSEYTLIRKLREELPEEEKEKILKIIEENEKGE